MPTLSYLTSERLVSPRESRYHAVLLVISLLLWALIALSIVGLIYAIAIAIFIWFVNGLFIAYIKAEAVKVSEAQLPELNTVLTRCCQLLALPKVPALYVMQSDGALNAFATRRAGRDFVVLYSDVVEAYGWNSAEVAFIIGHELGHVARRHIIKKLLTLPGTLIPLLGQAYSRACEATCDRYGMFCAQNTEGAVRAMAILSGGKEPGRKMDVNVFGRQYVEDRGFFVSWHELESGYPTLSQRVHNLLALGQGEEPKRASRSFLAYLFAIFFSRLTFFILFIAYIAVIALGIKAGAQSKLANQPAAITQSDNEDSAEYDDDDYEDEDTSEQSSEGEPRDE